MFRDPRYLAPLGVLTGVILASAVLALHGPGRSAAGSAASPTPAATLAAPATPTADDAAVDARRLLDLVKVRDALLAYRRLHGSFPVTKNGITTVCESPSDPGCVLASMPGGAPFTDGDQPYWFLSDGTRVVLVARALAESDTAQCPPALPPALGGVPLICLKFERPAQ